MIDKNGVTDFAALTAALEGHSEAPRSCFIFDILLHDGDDCRRLPLNERKAGLREALGRTHAINPLQISEEFTKDGETLLSTARAHGLEGLIAKRRDSP